ncbi:protein-L-isoaspartate(D-aspartate) O-methyltransferase [Nonomuraea lactucae]|uniref:protein-L-isoaspartate(D-aspartate) O-methyltransferase n=1 Tax=Nonomuraea lactucae TaxID=2249762 RepID=UPI0013B37FC6|nr:protein-L-isoaspartate(D-aspartate) O-methyltransferase [Nonomuraea lactucae]
MKTAAGRALDRIERLAHYLANAGVLPYDDPDSACWREALRNVPRHLFVPGRAWAQPMDDTAEHLIDLDADPGAWWEAVYSNSAIITQRGDGSTDVADVRAPATSSLSCPHIAAEFLRLLEVADHHRVLEIGTGTGWTAAMIGFRIGDDQVVTVEVDPGVAAAAATNLTAAGRSPLTLVGDGALGAADHAPYDRVHVTCGVRDIPYTWVEQSRPGGVIVAPYMTPHGQWGEQLRLDVLDDGTAVGVFRGGAAFMMMRSQRRPTKWPAYPDEGAASTTLLDPREPYQALQHGFGLALAAHAPRVTITSAGWEEHDPGEWMWTMRLRDLNDNGWALATACPGQARTDIVQGGTHRLWDDLQDAYMRWLRDGRPDRDRYRLTVTADSQSVWLDQGISSRPTT